VTLPIVICDDSGFARKQIARSLPTGWDVSATFAANGREAIEAVRAGRGDVLFLDLTMPEMDGFEVLEAIRREDLPTLTIVVSGDIQPEAHRRVLGLGALAFIRKPVDTAALREVLERFGLLTEWSEEAAVARETRVDFVDWCQEVANVAMGRAADLLARLLGINVLLSVPKVKLLATTELDTALAAVTGDREFSAVGQGFIGGGIAGEALLLFGETDMNDLAQLLHRETSLGAAAEVELLTDLANVLIGAFLNGLADQLVVHFSQGQPVTLIHGSHRQELFRRRADGGRQVLTIELSYSLGRSRIRCDQLLLFTEASAAALRRFASLATESA
jgi:CheY-like chemotaxis protein